MYVRFELEHRSKLGAVRREPVFELKRSIIFSCDFRTGRTGQIG